MSGLKDEKLIKSKPTRKLKHASFIPEYFEYFCQMSSKSIVIILSYTISKFARFFETQCTTTTTVLVLVMVGEGGGFVIDCCLLTTIHVMALSCIYAILCSIAYFQLFSNVVCHFYILSHLSSVCIPDTHLYKFC